MFEKFVFGGFVILGYIFRIFKMFLKFSFMVRICVLINGFDIVILLFKVIFGTGVRFFIVFLGFGWSIKLFNGIFWYLCIIGIYLVWVKYWDWIGFVWFLYFVFLKWFDVRFSDSGELLCMFKW